MTTKVIYMFLFWPFFSVASEVANKFKRLRTYYLTQVKKVKKGGRCKSKWALYDVMDKFLHDHVRARPFTSLNEPSAIRPSIIDNPSPVCIHFVSVVFHFWFSVIWWRGFFKVSVPRHITELAVKLVCEGRGVMLFPQQMIEVHLN